MPRRSGRSWRSTVSSRSRGRTGFSNALLGVCHRSRPLAIIPAAGGAQGASTATVPHSSRGPGHRPLKAEITGSNPVCGTNLALIGPIRTRIGPFVRPEVHDNQPMAYDERLVERIRQILGGSPDVVEKRMVGGRSFMVGGHLCCGVAGSDLMVRVGPDAYESALREPHTRPMEFAGRPLVGYVLVAPEGHRDARALESRLQQGIDFVATLPAKAA